MKLSDIDHLLKANRILASTLDLDKLLKVVLEQAAEVVCAETGSLLILDEKTNELTFDVALGDAGKDLRTIRLKLGEGIAGWVAQESKALIVNDPSSDPRWTRKADQKTKFVTRSILCVPMVYQGKLLGVVQAINRKDTQGFTVEDQEVLESFAAQAGVAIQNARLFSSLKQEKDKFETIFAQMADGALFCDEQGVIALANPAACQFLGMDRDRLGEHNLWQIFRSFTINPSLQPFLKGNEDWMEFDAARNEGKTFILSGIIKKIVSEKNVWIATLVVLRDVTLEKKQEKLKRDFLSLISHKLKTPLVAITGYTPILLEDEDLVKMSPVFKKGIESIHAQGIHLKQLVENLITFSLVEAEEMKIEKKPQILKKIVLDILAGMRTILDDKKVIVELDPSLDPLPPCPVDGEKFRAILRCLLENAIKFNTKDSKKVRIFAGSDSQFISLSIEDDGRGIPSEETGKIFLKFYQIEESFTGQVQGAGLGLALVKKLVEVHGGTVKVESRVGKGTTFTVTVPAS
ncbi:MAG: GAF domain-containing protein [Elusimicrobia bacterium]|nr:GAF domain-containing protein [Elusimicrobiota bacterium]